MAISFLRRLSLFCILSFIIVYSFYNESFFLEDTIQRSSFSVYLSPLGPLFQSIFSRAINSIVREVESVCVHLRIFLSRIHNMNNFFFIHSIRNIISIAFLSSYQFNWEKRAHAVISFVRIISYFYGHHSLESFVLEKTIWRTNFSVSLTQLRPPFFQYFPLVYFSSRKKSLTYYRDLSIYSAAQQTEVRKIFLMNQASEIVTTFQ